MSHGMRNAARAAIRRCLWLLPHDPRRNLLAGVRKQKFAELRDVFERDREGGASYERRIASTGIIFVHIPKNAGTSLSYALYKLSAPIHLSISKFALFYPARIFQTLEKVVVVRNPWARVYSAWRFLRNGGAGEIDRFRWNQYMTMFESFSDFVVRGLSSEMVQRWYPFSRQIEWVVFPGQSTVRVDRILRYETLLKDWKPLAEDSGLSGSIPMLNVSGYSSAEQEWRRAYNLHSREVVEKLYEEDIAAFDYSFD